MTNKSNILIVEDSSATAALLASTLEKNNYNIIDIVDSGEDAIARVRSNIPDLILMDIELNGSIDGIETAKIINSIRELPIIFVTANEDKKNLSRIKEAAPYGYLTKPFKSSDLFYAIETSIYKHQMIGRVKESEERLYVIWNNIQTGIMIIDESTNKIQSINPKTSEIIGISSENIIGHEKSEFFINIPDMEKSSKSQDNSNISKEALLLNNKKEIIPVFKTINKAKIMDKAYQIVSFFDISEQKKYELEIMNANDEIQALLSSLVTILIGVSIKDEVTHWNKIAELTFNIPASEVNGKPLTQCKIKWDWVIIYQGIYQSITDDKQVRLNDLHFIAGNGKEGFLDITINPIKDKDNAFSGFILSGEDITTKKQLEFQLVQAQKMESIGALSSGIAHEINTPTQYITDNTFFLQDAFSILMKLVDKNNELINIYNNDSNKAEEIIKEIGNIIKKNDLSYLSEEIPKAISQSIEGLSRVSKIVQSMKNFAHPGLNAKLVVDINRALDDTINISSNKWKYVADVITHYDKNLSSVPCYPGELNQVFLNIIINAVDAIEEKIGSSPRQKGVIDITTGIKDNWVIISVKDSGNGIPENISNKIFDPFFTTKKVGKGSGQGLAIAYDIIVNKHKGMINYESIADKGTTCIIKLPAYDTLE